MFLYLLSIHAYRAYATPLPSPLTEPADSLHSTSSPNPRTLWTIVYTCLATTLACTWISMHPNITQNKKWFTPLLMRLSLSLYALFVPEAIVFWAATQWKAACDYEAKYNQLYPHWTISHSFFLLMGGFTLTKEGDDQPEPVAAHRFDELLEKNLIEFPSVSQNDILDKSKGDPLAKGFVVLQTFWFVVQCAARFLQPGLDVAQIEVATLALVPVNVVIYFFWLKKPLSVKFSIPLKPTPTVLGQSEDKQEKVVDSAIQSPSVPMPTPAAVLEGDGETNIRSRQSTLAMTPPASISGRQSGLSDDDELNSQPLRRSPSLFSSIPPAPPRVLRVAKKIFTGLLLAFAVPALVAAVIAIALPPLLFAALFVLVLAFVVVIPFTLLLPFIASMEIGAVGRDPDHNVASKLPMFYAPPISDRSKNFMLAITTICATIFGGLHMLAWNFRFPTPTERLLWHISSVSLTALPVIYFTYHISQRILVPYRDWIRTRQADEAHRAKRILFCLLVWADRAGLVLVWSSLFLLGIPLYSLARLYILVESFIALRALTPGVLLAVSWAKFIPHF